MPKNSDGAGQAWDGVDFSDSTGLLKPGNGIYYGAYKHANSDYSYDDNSAPVLWNIMGEEESDDKITLLSRYILDYHEFDDDFNSYDVSDIRNWLNGTDNNGFLSDEKNTFMAAELGDVVNGPIMCSLVKTSIYIINNLPNVDGSMQETTDRFYLPWGTYNDSTSPYENKVWWSADDGSGTIPISYDLAGADRVATLRNINNDNISYWLRSPYSINTTIALRVTNDDHVYGYRVWGTLGIRPAFKLNPSSIIFASEIVNEITQNGQTRQDDVDSLKPYNYAARDDDGTNYKLTIVNSSIILGTLSDADNNLINESNTLNVESGGMLYLTGTAGEGTEEYHKLAYKIVDDNRTIVGYGTGPDDDDSSLPVEAVDLDGDELTAGEYTVYVWAQKDNDINSHEGSTPQYFTLNVTAVPDDPTEDPNLDNGDDKTPGANPSYPSSGSNYVTPAPSTSSTIPTEIRIILSGTAETAGTTIKAERQTDGTYLIIVPYGTDITALAPAFILPSGASVSPPSGTARDFSAGPLPYVVTAANGTTKQTYLVAVRAQSPAQTERPYFSILPSDCEIGYVINADGTVTASLRVLLADGSDPSLVEAVRATISGLTVSNVSYAYVDANGAVIPLPARNAAAAPYLQITFTAPSLGALEKGALEKITYWLKDDETEYVQTYSTITFPDITFVDETPLTDVPNNSNHGGGCDSGAAAALGLAGIISAGVVTRDKKRGV